MTIIKTLTTQIKEDDNEWMEIDAKKLAFGKRLQHHWIDGFALELQTKYKITTDLVQYAPDRTVALRVSWWLRQSISMQLLRALFDSGGSALMINDQCLPKGCVPTLLTNNITSTTIAGNFT